MRASLFIFAQWIVAPLAMAQNEQNVYKWVDRHGQTHYGTRQPADTTAVQKLTIPLTSSPGQTKPSSRNALSEIERISALAEQMERKNNTMEKERQERALRDLEMENKILKNTLLKHKLQQKTQPSSNESSEPVHYFGYPYYSGYPPYRLPCFLPPCHRTIPPIKPIHTITPKIPRPQRPRAKPDPTLKPNPQGVFRGHTSMRY